MSRANQSAQRTKSPQKPQPESGPPPHVDVAVVVGALSSDPVERTLPSGDIVVNYEVTCRCDGATHSVPVAWFTPPKRRAALRAGDEIVVVGQVRRRFFRSGGATASRTEVVADTVSRREPTSVSTAAMALRALADTMSGPRSSGSEPNSPEH